MYPRDLPSREARHKPRKEAKSLFRKAFHEVHIDIYGLFEHLRDEIPTKKLKVDGLEAMLRRGVDRGLVPVLFSSNLVDSFPWSLLTEWFEV